MSQTDATISSVRRISSELRPRILDDLGLVAAIEWQAQQFEAKTGIHCTCESFLETVNLRKEQTSALYRIFQEAMTNILRHSRATRVQVTMDLREGNFILQVRDNGVGIPEDMMAGAQSLGLMGMRERAQLIGGTIGFSREEGTVLTVRVPLPKES